MKHLQTAVLNSRFALFWVAALAMGIIALAYANPSFGAQNTAADAVVDIRLVPDSATISPGAQFNVAIQVEPNGQQVAGVQAFVNFDPSIVQVTALTLDSSSPLTVQLLNKFDNTAGQIDFAAGSFTSSPSTTFVAANIAFTAANVDAATTLSLSRESPRQTIASVEADEVLRDLIGAEIIIGNPLPTPTPSPVPTDTPTPEPTPTPTVTNTPVVTPTPQSDTPTPINTATPTAAPTATPSPTVVLITTATPPPSQIVDIRLESNVDSLIGGDSFNVAVIVEP
ncbi:MAG: cohesin domain-containing protein, partial [Pirellulaceae bacterium]|nr:cohesin domain-containing protein [Pirellulaceae bacterium]